MQQSDRRFLYLGSGMLATLTEMTLLGHAIESTKIMKQSSNTSYPTIFRSTFQQGWRGLYRGFYPWAIIQSTKGIPILFTQSFVKDYSYPYFIQNNNPSQAQRKAGILGGICGGIAQAFFITPTQRLKIEAITSSKKNRSFNTTLLLSDIYKKQGICGLWRGLRPMTCKKGVDWGIRFSGIEAFKQTYPDFYDTFPGKICAGMVGGSLSILTVPFDVMVASMQKSNSSGKIFQAFRALKKEGLAQLYRGGVFRFIHTSYHTGILVGFGSFYKELMDRSFFGDAYDTDYS